jgi:hypothetical protein
MKGIVIIISFLLFFSGKALDKHNINKNKIVYINAKIEIISNKLDSIKYILDNKYYITK